MRSKFKPIYRKNSAYIFDYFLHEGSTVALPLFLWGCCERTHMDKFFDLWSKCVTDEEPNFPFDFTYALCAMKVSKIRGREGDILHASALGS